PGEYLVLYANNPDSTSGIHLGFSLKSGGEEVHLYDNLANGGGEIDSVNFGPQIDNLSIGRLADGTWGLTTPTFGAANVAEPVGDPHGLKINEWLADGFPPFNNDYIELYNPDPLPVPMGGLYLTDRPTGWPNENAIAPLSFIAGK